MKIFLSVLLPISTLCATNLSNFINKINCDQIINKSIYTSCYDYNYKSSLYIAYELDGKLVNKTNLKKRNSFYTEKNLPKKYRSHTKDYTHSGYDRGHLASDASFDYDKKTVRKTYSMINVIPQAPNVNRKTWLKVERYERLIATKLGSVNVINGIIFDNKPMKIGKNQISVPAAFWKMIYNDNKNFKKCFYYKNDLDAKIKDDKLKHHIISCKKIENL